MEQRANLKVLVKLGQSPNECCKFFNEVYGKDVVSRTRVSNGTNVLRVAVRKWRMTPGQEDLLPQRPTKHRKNKAAGAD